MRVQSEIDTFQKCQSAAANGPKAVVVYLMQKKITVVATSLGVEVCAVANMKLEGYFCSFAALTILRLLRDLKYFFFSQPIFYQPSVTAGVFVGRSSKDLDRILVSSLPISSLQSQIKVLQYKIAYLSGHFYRAPYTRNGIICPGDTVKMRSSGDELVYINIQGFYLVKHPVAVTKYVVGIRYYAWQEPGALLPLVDIAEDEPEIEAYKLDEILSIVVLHPSALYKTLKTVREALALHEPPTLVSYSNSVAQ
jgi:hypothetical protein